MTKKLIKNIGVLATPSGSKAKAGSDQGKINQLEHAWLLWEDDKIIDLGQGAPPSADQELDANGHLVTPGLVDPHTHLVFGGWREHELAMKLKGVPYLDILAAGGGILSTVRSTRAASTEQLISKTLPVLERMLALGVTTCEAKSGYGLALEHEIKMLEAVKELGSLQPIELVSTFMAAHALPEEYKADREAYLDLVINTMIPQVAEKGLAEYCDVFCETTLCMVNRNKLFRVYFIEFLLADFTFNNCQQSNVNVSITSVIEQFLGVVNRIHICFVKQFRYFFFNTIH